MQRQHASGHVQSHLIHIPTGTGKTVATILAWLWRLKADRANTPRRLIYCLPMRVLVEQTRDRAREWVKNLKSSVWADLDVDVCTLIGGEVRPACHCERQTGGFWLPLIPVVINSHA